MLNAIKKRRSYRKFKKNDLDKEKLDTILLSAMSAPSAYHRNPWHFIVVKNEEIRMKLSRATNYANFAKDAPAIIVICGDEPKSDRWIEDCAIAGAHIYLETTNQKLGTCMIQILGMVTPDGQGSEEYVKKLLNIPDTIRVLVMMPIGYPDEKLEEHDESKFAKEKVHDEKW